MNLAPAARMTVTSFTIPSGDAGTAATTAAMRALIERGKKDPDVRALAVSILHRAHVKAFDWMGEARAIYASVLRNMRFTRDVRDKETLHEAPVLIRMQAGDCDDFVILLCSLLESVGMRTRIVTVAGDPEDPAAFTHVYPEVEVGGRWIPVDAARRHPKFGAAPSKIFRKQIWDDPDGNRGNVKYLNGFIPGPNTRLAPWNPRMPAALRKALAGPAPIRGNPRGLRGFGNYGRRGLQRLGQDSSDWTQGDTTQVLSETPQLEVGVADIISASRASPYNLNPTTNPNSTINPAAPNYLAQAGLSSLLSSPLLLLGLGAIALFAFTRGGD